MPRSHFLVKPIVGVNRSLLSYYKNYSITKVAAHVFHFAEEGLASATGGSFDRGKDEKFADQTKNMRTLLAKQTIGWIVTFFALTS